MPEKVKFQVVYATGSDDEYGAASLEVSPLFILRVYDMNEVLGYYL